MKWPRLFRKFRLTWLILLLAIGLLVAACQACAPAATPAAPSASQTSQAAPAAPTATTAAAAPEPTQAPAAAQATATNLTETKVAQPTAPSQPTVVPTQQPLIEGRLVELEWPDHLRIGDSDVIRLALIPTKEGYLAKAEFPNHELQTKEVPVPRPNGYELFAIARLDGIGFQIEPTGDQERFVPAGEEIAWRWTLSARQPGQHRLSVNLALRWKPGPGVIGIVRESQAYSRGLDVQVTSFIGLSPAQAASTGFAGMIIGCGFMLVALVWRRGQVVRPAAPALHDLTQAVAPNPALTIESPPGMQLQEEEGGLLRALFQKYDRLVIENEFLSGYSGARTFLVRPIRPDGCADALTIVKLGPRPSIEGEYQNYETFVKDRLPPMTARIQQPPVVLSNGKSQPKKTVGDRQPGRAAVQYTFIAEPGHSPISLRQALLNTPDPTYLTHLFETFGPSWWMQRRSYTFRLGQEYDSLLPPHYVLEPVIGVHTGAPIRETNDPSELALQPGMLVQVQPFSRSELRADGKSYSLLGQGMQGRPALRLRWLAGHPPVGPCEARVVANRLDLLRGWTSSFDRFGMLDPLNCLDLLDETISGTRSVIHGDLNLENVLVGPGNLVWLIDFAQTREGHPLYDFAHLESELIAHVLAVRAGSAEVYLDLWRSNRDPLLNALHAIAARCLFDPARPREYHLALYMACLGALKYPNLSPLAKHCLYLTAAELAQSVLE